MVTRAAIVDIGSNSLRYMEGVCDEGVVRSYIKLLVTTRLAEGLSHTGRIKRENMLNSIEVLSEFRDRASKNGRRFTHTLQARCAMLKTAASLSPWRGVPRG